MGDSHVVYKSCVVRVTCHCVTCQCDISFGQSVIHAPQFIFLDFSIKTSCQNYALVCKLNYHTNDKARDYLALKQAQEVKDATEPVCEVVYVVRGGGDIGVGGRG